MKKEHLNRIKEMVKDQDILNDYLTLLKHDEPEYYHWSYKMAGKFISDLNDKTAGSLPMGLASGLAHAFLIAFTSGYMVYKFEMEDNLNDKVRDIDDTDDGHFKQWLDGKLPSKYYDYTLRGLKKDSSKYIALKNFREREAKRKEKEKFQDMKENLKKKKSKDNVNIKDFLSRFEARDE